MGSMVPPASTASLHSFIIYATYFDYMQNTLREIDCKLSELDREGRFFTSSRVDSGSGCREDDGDVVVLVVRAVMKSRKLLMMAREKGCLGLKCTSFWSKLDKLM